MTSADCLVTMSDRVAGSCNRSLSTAMPTSARALFVAAAGTLRFGQATSSRRLTTWTKEGSIAIPDASLLDVNGAQVASTTRLAFCWSILPLMSFTASFWHR